MNLSGTQFSVVPGLGIIADGSSTRVDTSIVARKYSVTIGDGTNTSYTVTHNLGTQDIHITVKEVSSNSIVFTDMQAATTNTCIITFGSAIASNTYRVTVIA